MNINIVYVSDDLTDFHVDDPTSNWITNCYSENFYGVNTGDILSKETLGELPFVNVSNSGYYDRVRDEMKTVIVKWWKKIHPEFLSDLGLPTHPTEDKITDSKFVKQWAKWTSAIDVISIDNTEASSTCVLTSDLNLIPKDLPDLASKLQKEKWQETWGDGVFEASPINGSLDIFVDSDYQIIIGHYHALFQMFKMQQLKWFLSNLHLTGSSITKWEDSFLHMMAKHIGLRVNEIT